MRLRRMTYEVVKVLGLVFVYSDMALRHHLFVLA